MNEKYIFFRKNKVVQYLEFCDHIFDNKVKDLSLSIDILDEESYVKSVLTGSNPH